MSPGVTLTIKEINDIVIVIRFTQNRKFLLKRTTGKCIGKEGGLLSFLGPLMSFFYTFNEKFTEPTY